MIFSDKINEKYDLVVVGTGPTSMAFLTEWLKANHGQVLVVDAGQKVPFANRSVEAAYGAFDDVPYGLKAELGESSFYDFDHAVVSPKTKLFGSKAHGGFSLVWGRVFNDFSKVDEQGFPIELTSSYLSEYRSNLVNEIVEVHSPDDGKKILLDSAYDQEVYLGLKKNFPNIKWTSLALSKTDKDIANCVRCNHCIIGCPYRYFFSSDTVLESLMAQYKNIQLVSNSRVVELVEEESFVNVRYLKSNEEFSISAAKVVSGAGVLSDIRMLKKYLREPVNVKDSAYFVVPVFRLWFSKNKPTLDAHSMCKYTISIPQRGFEKPIKIQFYNYNQVYGKKIAKMIPFKMSLLGKFIDFFVERLSVSMVFLSSKDSPYIKIEHKNGESLNGILQTPAKYKNKIWYLKFSLMFKLLRSGWLSVPFLWMNKDAGMSFHVGSTFPMGGDSESNHTDAMGRPNGLRRVHLIDSSVLPEIPAGSLTSTIMANAMRVGRYVK